MDDLGCPARALLSEGRRSRSSSLGIERILRMCIAQQYFHLSDEGIEEVTTTASQFAVSFVSISARIGADPEDDAEFTPNAGQLQCDCRSFKNQRSPRVT